MVWLYLLKLKIHIANDRSAAGKETGNQATFLRRRDSLPRGPGAAPQAKACSWLREEERALQSSPRAEVRSKHPAGPLMLRTCPRHPGGRGVHLPSDAARASCPEPSSPASAAPSPASAAPSRVPFPVSAAPSPASGPPCWEPVGCCCQ